MEKCHFCQNVNFLTKRDFHATQWFLDKHAVVLTNTVSVAVRLLRAVIIDDIFDNFHDFLDFDAVLEVMSDLDLWE